MERTFLLNKLCMQFFLENKSKMDRLNICINFFVEEKNKRVYKRYVVWESTPIISFCWSVCYWKWWRHYTWWIEPRWWRQLLVFFDFLFSFKKLLNLFVSTNIWICVLRFMGELCRADLWRFFFERPHFHNRSEFNRP